MSDQFPLSVVILAKNEEINIRRCVAAVSWCREVVVVDDESTDRTVDIAISAGARVVIRRFSSFAGQRNWALREASLLCDWVLMLDADEVVTPELRRELMDVLPQAGPDVVAYRLCRKTIVFDRWLKHADDFPVWIMRLVRRGRVEFEDRGHGEVAVPQVAGEMATIREPLEHHVLSKGLEDWVARHNRYSTREAELEIQSDCPVRWRNFVSRDRSTRRQAWRALSRCLPFRPQLRFLYQYVLKGGFLDGSPGFVFCSLLATYEGWIVLKRREFKRAAAREELREALADLTPASEGANVAGRPPDSAAGQPCATATAQPSPVHRRGQRLRRAGVWIVALALLFAFHAPILRSAAHWMNIGDPLNGNVDVAFVLGGDAEARSTAAAELVRTRQARAVLISASIAPHAADSSLPARDADLIEQLLTSHGVDPCRLSRLPRARDSTLGEVDSLCAYLNEHPANSVAIVTNDYHTRRTRMLLQRRLSCEQLKRVSLVSCPTRGFGPDDWWRSANGRQIYLTEFLKLIVQGIWLRSASAATLSS